MNKMRLTFLLLLVPFLINAQPFNELSDSKPHDDAKVWNALKSNFQFSWGNTDTRYPKLSIPLKPGMENRDGSSDHIKLTAWRGEQVNAQAVFFTKMNLKDVSFSVSALRNGRSIISPSEIQLQPVYYIMTDELNKDGKGGCRHTPDPTKFDSSVVADMLGPVSQGLTIPARTTRPVWLTINVPGNAQPGSYKGSVSVNVPGHKTKTLQITLEIKNRQLPPPTQWSFHLDLWQNPYAVARYHQVPLWSKEHFDLMRPLMKRLANAGQKVITTTIMHRPWNGQTYDAFGSMIRKTKTANGGWQYDYEVFDRWVNFMINDIGISQQINCYTMVPWALNFDYYEAGKDDLQFIQAKPGSREFTDYWLPFLTDFARHLKAKGWFSKTTIAMDERSMKDMQETIKVIKQAEPDFKVSLAGNYHQEIEKDIYDYCIAYKQKFPDDIKAQRERQHKISTVYTCCAEPFPNTFTFSAPAEATWIGLHAAAGNYDGYLRWAYNSWPEKPMQDSRFRSWAAGDTYLVYPDGLSSIRFQRLVEGIQDYEKIRILRKELSNDPGKLKKLNDVLALFTPDGKGTQPTESTVREAQNIINGF